jgi:hypothetical protein
VKINKFLSILMMICLPGLSHAVGKFPYTPNVSNTKIEAHVTYDSANGRFEYSYSLSSSPDNVGKIDSIMLDIKSFRVFTKAPDDFLLLGMGSDVTFEEEVSELKNLLGLSFDFDFEPVGTVLPERWVSSIGASGYLNLMPPPFGANSAGEFVEADLIDPGESVGNLRVKALSPPTLKEIVVKPFWRYMSTAPTEDQQDETERLAAGNLEASLLIRKVTLGPERVNYGDSLHNRTVTDINKMLSMGWVSDQALVNQILVLLSDAKTLRYSQQGSEAQAKYQQVLDLMAPAMTSQMRQEAIDLININVKILLNHLSDTFIAPE